MTFDALLANIVSAPVLAFVLGMLAVAVRSDLRIPEALTQTFSIYLLLAIGVKGGVALRGESAADVLGPVGLALVLGILIPLAAYGALRWMSRLGPVDRGSVAAHYGSTSLVTFTAALVFLDSAGTLVPGYAATLLTVLEVPGIVVGLLLANRHAARHVGWAGALHEVLAGKSIVLLVGGLLLGWAIGAEGYAPIAPLFGDAFRGVLTLFLLGLGIETGTRLRSVRTAGPGLIGFALLFPVVAGGAGVLAGSLIGMPEGGAAILGVLCASASYIAAPAAVRYSLPEANPAIPLAASLGVTFPFNLVIGIPLLAQFASVLAG
jgi:uncharacterized protein